MLKFIPRTSDFADFCKNSFRGPRISRTFVKIHSADLGFRGLFLRSAGSARSSGSAKFTWPLGSITCCYPHQHKEFLHSMLPE